MAKTWISGSYYPGGSALIYRSTDNGATWGSVYADPTATAIQVVATDSEGNWVVGTDDGQLLRSSNDGLNWTPVLDIASGVFSSIASDKHNHWCAGVNAGTLSYVSGDRGVTWTGVNLASDIYLSLATDMDGVWCGGEDGYPRIWRSTNDGASWAVAGSVTGEEGIESLATDNAGVWCGGTKKYTAKQAKIIRSTDNGATWGAVFTTGERRVAGMATDRAGVWCAVTQGSALILRSTDNGATWGTVLNASNTGTFLDTIATDREGVWCAGFYDSVDILRSTDNGATWGTVTGDANNAAIYGMAASGSAESTTVTLLSINRQTDMADYVSRIYPRASGISLADTTRSAPSGYDLQAALGYITSTTNEALYGRRERAVNLDVNMPTVVNSLYVQQVFAADALYDKALKWLQQHDTVADFYSIEVTGITDIASCRPGQSIHVTITAALDGTDVETIDGDFNIISMNRRLEGGKILILQMELSTIEREALSEGAVMATAWRNANRNLANAGSGSSSVTIVDADVAGLVDRITTIENGALYTAQDANLVYAGPASGTAAVPAFRALVFADIPSSSNPGAAASVLASSAAGYLQLIRLGLGVAPTVRLEVVPPAVVSQTYEPIIILESRIPDGYAEQGGYIGFRQVDTGNAVTTADAARIVAVHDALTNAAGNTALAFWTSPNAGSATEAVRINGNGTTKFSYPVLLPDGAWNAPSIGFSSEGGLGFYRVGASTISFLVGYTAVCQFVAAGVQVIGNLGVGTAPAGARLKLAAGSATANTAPLKFISGTLLTTAEAGAAEFLTDDYFLTISTGEARKGIVLDDGSRLTSGKIPIATTNGRLIDLTAQAHEADAKADYGAGDLDTEAEIITALNATNTKINNLLAKLETLKLLAAL